MQLPFSIQIPRRAAVCCSGGEPFLPGAECCSCLCFLEGESRYERQDFCLSCWNTRTLVASDIFWKSRLPLQKENEPRGREHAAQALSLLKTALGAEGGSARLEAFVLALYLARKRVLASRKELVVSESPARLYEVLESGEMLYVPEIKLSEVPVPEVQSLLAGKFA